MEKITTEFTVIGEIELRDKKFYKEDDGSQMTVSEAMDYELDRLEVTHPSNAGLPWVIYDAEPSSEEWLEDVEP